MGGLYSSLTTPITPQLTAPRHVSRKMAWKWAKNQITWKDTSADLCYADNDPQMLTEFMPGEHFSYNAHVLFPQELGKVAYGYRVGEKVKSLIAFDHGNVQIKRGDVGTVAGPCLNKNVEDYSNRVHITFHDKRGMFFFKTTEIERDPEWWKEMKDDHHPKWWKAPNAERGKDAQKAYADFLRGLEVAGMQETFDSKSVSPPAPRCAGSGTPICIIAQPQSWIMIVSASSSPAASSPGR